MFRNKQDAKKLDAILGYTFKDRYLLIQAWTRISATNENKQERRIGHHQRLTFLGDKVLNAVIS